MRRLSPWLPRRLGPQLVVLTTLAMLLGIGGHAAWVLHDQSQRLVVGLKDHARALAENLAVSSAGPLVQLELDRIEDLLLRASYSLDLWGKDEQALASALDTVRAGEAQAHAVRLSLATAVVQAYVFALLASIYLNDAVNLH